MGEIGDRKVSFSISFGAFAMNSARSSVGLFDPLIRDADFLAITIFVLLFLARDLSPLIIGSFNGAGFVMGTRELGADFIAARGEMPNFARLGAEEASSSESLMTRSRFRGR